MENAEKIKSMVKEKYGEIAGQSREQNASSCCGSGGCCSDSTYTVFSEDYSKLEGYTPDADLGLGCGIPTKYVEIKPGETVLDLGSGAGNDAFVVRQLVGEQGRVIGLDMTDAMIEKARQNNARLGYANVEFILGDIEKIPLPANTVDVVVSNCVLNLVPDKAKAFGEVFRVMKPGGRFSISDIVIQGELPARIRSAAEMYAGCVGGAVRKDEYLSIIKTAGFEDVTVPKERRIDIPDETLLKHLNPTELETFKRSGTAILSITACARKPGRTES
jgi:SAM-dependent methyltransferase